MQYREHDYGSDSGNSDGNSTSVDRLTANPNNNAYITFSNDKTYIIIHTREFSSYVIGYSYTSPTELDPPGFFDITLFNIT